MKLWIARQQDNSVYLFTHKHTLFCGRWCMNGVNQFYTSFWKNKVSADIFPEVTFENSPQEVELELCSDYQKEINKMKKLYYELRNNDLLKKCKYYKDKFCKLGKMTK